MINNDVMVSTKKLNSKEKKGKTVNVENPSKNYVRPISSAYLFIKRCFDIIVSLVGLILLSPLFFIIFVAIKLDTDGDATYKHKRIGKNGKTIELYKFRTMVKNSDEVFLDFTPEQKAEFEKHFKLENDPRITFVGKFLREASLDELPQLVNILKGELSLVGPRPVVEREIYKYGNKANKFLSVTPGLTGYWQANGRSNTTYEQRVEMDMYYIDNCSLWLDIKILFQTAIAVFRKDGAC